MQRNLDYDYDNNLDMKNFSDLELKKCNPSRFFNSLPMAEQKAIRASGFTFGLSGLTYLIAGMPVAVPTALWFFWCMLEQYSKDKKSQNDILDKYFDNDLDVRCADTILIDYSRNDIYKKCGIMLGGKESDDMETHCNRVEYAVALCELNPTFFVKSVNNVCNQIKNKARKFFNT